VRAAGLTGQVRDPGIGNSRGLTGQERIRAPETAEEVNGPRRNRPRKQQRS
jgi:hypothetical protein